MRVVGIRLLVLGAEVEQLFEVADAADLLFVAAGAADRLGQPVELHGEALDVHRVGHHALDRALQHMDQVAFPAMHEGLRAGDGDAAGLATTRWIGRLSTWVRLASQLLTNGWALAMVTLSLSTATARILWRWAKA
ncbi:hypothetical protein D3C81_1786150 [compost metagenome]